MKIHRNRGFTLIELLVVIAIIGILSAVVLASLNTARSKGNDAAVQTNLNTVRVQAELFYGDNTNSYNTGSDILSAACSPLTTAGSILADANIHAALVSAKNATGNESDCGIHSSTYSIAAPLKTGTGAWCIDSTGVSRNKTAGGTTYLGDQGAGGNYAHTTVGQFFCN